MKEILDQWDRMLTYGIGSYEASESVGELDALFGRDYTEIISVGMGGSGIIGSLMRQLISRQGEREMICVNSPDLPASVCESSLVILVSYSGNTWETLEAYEAARRCGAHIVVLSSGGELLSRARYHGVPFIELVSGFAPRAALGMFVGAFLCLFDDLELYPGRELLKKLEKSFVQHKNYLGRPGSYRHFIRQFAGERFFHVWGVSGDSDVLAYRAQTQFNENSKIAAVSGVFPELNHNLLVGFTENYHVPVLFLKTQFVSSSLDRSYQALLTVCEEHDITVYETELFGDSWEEQFFYGIWWADYASYYLGKARNTAITDVLLIDRLKEVLRQEQC